MSISDFTLDSVLHETPSLRIVRGHRNSDGIPVVAKLLVAEYPRALKLARLRREYEILNTLDVPGVVRPISLEKYGNRLALILEDLGNHALSTMIQAQGIELSRFLDIALAMTTVIETIHQNNIIHKDIKPHHFFVNGVVSTVKLIDFGIATCLPRETMRLTSPSELEGTLAYVSPEQTGRMNRMLDRRTDLYSLGVSFYQLSTGVLPFQANDPLELVHSHLVRAPRPPCDIRPDLPRVMSDIILKLLAKAPEDRYPDATSLKVDLQVCLEQVQRTGGVKTFPIASRAFTAEFQVPRKLYGREEETQALRDTLEPTLLGGSQILLISGYSGVGKSTLANELQKDMVRRGHFVSGKFSNLVRDTPYTPIAHACRELIQLNLSRPTAEFEAWRDRLLDILGPNAQLVIDLVPELELAIGPQPAVKALEPQESRNRFELVFLRFIQSFISAEQPLVLFLDDMQWADHASLRFIHLLLTDSQSSHLLLLGAFRDNEVDSVHPLTLGLQDLKKVDVPVREISLKPLGMRHVRQMLAETLAGCHADTLHQLAETTLRKTEGNPFFVSQFLSELHKKDLLSFDPSTCVWKADIERIKNETVTDNVVNLMVARFRRMTTQRLRILQLAACIGHQLDLRTLSILSGQRPAEAAAALEHCIREDFIFPIHPNIHNSVIGATDTESMELDPIYQFSHDRIQQAVYATIAETERQVHHLALGRLILDMKGAVPLEEDLFKIVHHLNMGVALVKDSGERREIARLNLRAGRKARDSAAHQEATKLLDTAISLCGDNIWTTDYEIALEAFYIKAECEYLGGRPEEAIRLLEMIESHAQTTLDRIPARKLKLSVLTSMNRMPEALDFAHETVKLFGMNIPKTPNEIESTIGEHFGYIQTQLAERTIGSLIDLPAMGDPEKLAITDILFKSNPAAFQVDPNLMVLHVLIAIRLFIDHGNATCAPYFYESYGIVHPVVTGDYEVAYQFGRLGIDLAAKIANPAITGPSHLVFASFNAHWCRGLSESQKHYRLGMKASLEAGDLAHALYCATSGAYYSLHQGRPLNEILPLFDFASELLNRTIDIANEKQWTLIKQVLKNLQGLTTTRTSLDSEGFSEEEFTASFAGNYALSVFYHLHKAMVLYLAGDFAGALTEADAAQPLSPGMFFLVEHCFYRAMALAARAHEVPQDKRSPIIADLHECEETLRAWADLNPADRASRHALIVAELAVVTGAADDAITSYDEAIELARRDGALHIQALANELCAKYNLSRGRSRIARVYMAQARFDWACWGASAKAQHISDTHVELLAHGQSSTPWGSASLAVTDAARLDTSHALTHPLNKSSTATGNLDLMSAIRATQAITSELVLDNLLARLMKTLSETAGAQKVHLVLIRDGAPQIAASLSTQPDIIETSLSESLEGTSRLPVAVVHYVVRSQGLLLAKDAATDPRFHDDPYVIANQPKSILCLEMLHRGHSRGVLYLENNVTTDAFPADRIELLRFLAAQAATAVENAELYQTLEERVERRTAELQKANQEKLSMARRAGMAEIAIGTLHNVGNILNSVCIASDVLDEKLQTLRIPGLRKAVELMETHADTLADFLTRDPRGKNLLPYLRILTESLESEQAQARQENHQLRQRIERIKTVVAQQQKYAKPITVMEDCNIGDLIAEAISIVNVTDDEHGIAIVSNCDGLSQITADRHQVLQILINLLSNAKHAVTNGGKADKTITINASLVNGDRFQLRVEDNGVGIPKEIGDKIFIHGFTTRKDGHGFGLHSASLSAKAMGGELSAASDGAGCGAVFTLELPLRSPQSGVTT